MLHFLKYFFKNYCVSTEYFTHAAHSSFFSSKCCLFYNALLFTFYVQGVLKFKCKTQVPKVNTFLLTPWSRVLLEKLTVNFAASQEIPRIFAGPCHHGMARPQVADGGTASCMEGSCE
jgi:hypothetical protein